jgi:hypothetical protein
VYRYSNEEESKRKKAKAKTPKDKGGEYFTAHRAGFMILGPIPAIVLRSAAAAKRVCLSLRAQASRADATASRAMPGRPDFFSTDESTT